MTTAVRTNRPKGRIWLSMPARYLVIALVVAITVAPMLYLIVGGFSTTAQLNTDPNTLQIGRAHV